MATIEMERSQSSNISGTNECTASAKMLGVRTILTLGRAILTLTDYMRNVRVPV